MCFSNLPVEFDEAGNPYLADEAETVERPSVAGDDTEIDVDPTGAYEAILDSLPPAVRADLAAGRGDRTRRPDGIEGD